VSALGEVDIDAAVDGNFLAGIGITSAGALPVDDTGGGSPPSSTNYERQIPGGILASYSATYQAQIPGSLYLNGR
jgi:hypothetical protein